MNLFLKLLVKYKYIFLQFILLIILYLSITDNPTFLIEKTYSFPINASQEYLYILDAGHDEPNYSKCDTKAIWDNAKNKCFYEYEFNLDVRSYLASFLIENSIEYIYLNDSGIKMSLNERVKKINKIVQEQKKFGTKCILISIHGNYAHNKKAEAFEFYTQDTTKITKQLDEDKNIISKKVAERLLNSYKNVFSKNSWNKTFTFRTKESNFQILRESNCPSILIENNFYSNDSIRELMWTKEFKFLCAFSIFEMILTIESYRI